MCHYEDRRSGLEGDGWNSIKSWLKKFVFKSLPWIRLVTEYCPVPWNDWHHFVVIIVQSPNHAQHFATTWTVTCQASLSLTTSLSLPKFMSIALVMPSSYPIIWHPLLLLPSVFPNIRDFSNESAVLIRLPKYWSFSFSINPYSEYSGLISLKIDWFDLLAVQGTLRSLL